MLLNFRQGIYRPKTFQQIITSPYLQKANNDVFLKVTEDDPLYLSFCHYGSNVLYKESIEQLAWTNIPINCWLYWDIDLITGIRTFGTTTLEPLMGNAYPSNSTYNQMFFNLSDNTMRFWSSDDWTKCLRLIAAKVSNGFIIGNYITVNESQVGLNQSSRAGYLLLKDNKIIKAGNNLITSTTPLKTQKNHFNTLSEDALINYAIADERLQKNDCITFSTSGRIKKTSSNDVTNTCMGIAIEDAQAGEVIKYKTRGFIKDTEEFEYKGAANKPIFVNEHSKISITPPEQISIQKLGFVVSEDTIYLDLQEKILIEEYERIEEVCASVTCIIPEFCSTISCPFPEYCTTIECTLPEFCTTIECTLPEFCTTIECTLPEFCTTIECTQPIDEGPIDEGPRG